MHIVTDVFPVMRVQNLPLITCGTGDNIKATGGRRQHWCQWESFHWSIVYTVGATQSLVGRWSFAHRCGFTPIL